VQKKKREKKKKHTPTPLFKKIKIKYLQFSAIVFFGCILINSNKFRWKYFFALYTVRNCCFF